MTDSTPNRSGALSGAESVNETSQLTSHPCGAGPNRKCFVICQARWIRRIHGEFWKRLLEHEIGIIGRGMADLEISRRRPGQFV